MFFRFKFHPNFNLKFRFVDKCFGFFGAADADADGSRQGDETFRFSRVIRRKCPKNPKNFGDPTSDPGQGIFFRWHRSRKTGTSETRMAILQIF